MPSREEIYTEARRWVGTPYHHQGRTLGQSCDCIGLLIGVARALGIACPPNRDFPRYSALPHDGVAERTVSEFLAPATGLLPGQIGMFWFRDRGHGQHFAIFGRHGRERLTMIHAYFNIGKVVETGVSDFWRKRLMQTFDYSEVANA